MIGDMENVDWNFHVHTKVDMWAGGLAVWKRNGNNASSDQDELDFASSSLQPSPTSQVSVKSLQATPKHRPITVHAIAIRVMSRDEEDAIKHDET